MGILKRVAFEFAPGVRRGLNGYGELIACRKGVLHLAKVLPRLDSSCGK